jgi:hypothetical protein
VRAAFGNAAATTPSIAAAALRARDVTPEIAPAVPPVSDLFFAGDVARACSRCEQPMPKARGRPRRTCDACLTPAERNRLESARRWNAKHLKTKAVP